MFCRARAHVRTLMTQKSCKVGMCNAILRNYLNKNINDFENPTARDDETIIPVHWFDERTKIGIQLPFRRRNEFESRKFITKLNKYTKWKFNFHIF